MATAATADKGNDESSSSPSLSSSSTVVAVVGGGIAGAVAARRLAKQFRNVILFDQGRRGPGGRASHRTVSAVDGSVLSDDDILSNDGGGGGGDDGDGDGGEDGARDGRRRRRRNRETYEFDHGCQFFRADSVDMQRLAEEWVEEGWAAPWKARIGSLSIGHDSGGDGDGDDGPDFFGVPSNDSEQVYIGLGGMHGIPRRMLNATDCHVSVHAGTRVAKVEKSDDCGGGGCPKWNVYGTTGTAAYHDTPGKGIIAASGTASSSPPLLLTADIVVFTDISTSSESWHRASAGMPPDFRETLLARNGNVVRVPMFSCMVALDRPVAKYLPCGAFVVSGAGGGGDGDGDASVPALWFAACSQSKPGFYDNGGGSSGNNNNNDDDCGDNPEEEAECWTLVSSPGYAFHQIKNTPMRDPTTGEFIPQSNGYLNSIPGPDLFADFCTAIEPHLAAAQTKSSPPKAIYLQAQRWGSGLPVPESLATSVEEVEGTRYATSLRSSLVYPRRSIAADGDTDYVADDASGMYCAGDFCSKRNPGFEAAALSGLDVADHILSLLKDE